jgi:hypothetical protein
MIVFIEDGGLAATASAPSVACALASLPICELEDDSEDDGDDIPNTLLIKP